ncbi:hypothetical protein P9112_008173 [Eukaryota sp. TZLM1-RC]
MINDLDPTSSLKLEKHVKLFLLKVCYTGRITEILKFCASSIALDFYRSFNSLRTKLSSDLLDLEPGMLKSYLFSAINFGGVGFTKSSFLCQAAFLGGCKNFIFKFSRRFPENSHLLVPSCSPYLNELSCELDRLPPHIWTKCFPKSIQENPNRSLVNMQFCCKSFNKNCQRFLTASILMLDLTSSRKRFPLLQIFDKLCVIVRDLVTTIAQVHGTLLTDSARTLNMKPRSCFWHDNLLHHFIC